MRRTELVNSALKAAVESPVAACRRVTEKDIAAGNAGKRSRHRRRDWLAAVR
jgi:hypothetical protein